MNWYHSGWWNVTTFQLIRVDKSSDFRVEYPKKPEPKVRVAGRVGFYLRIRVFSGQKTRKKLKIRVGSGLKNSGFFPTLVATYVVFNVESDTLDAALAY